MDAECTNCVRIIAMIRRIVVTFLTSLSALCIVLVPLSFLTSETEITSPETYRHDASGLLVRVTFKAQPDRQSSKLPPKVCRVQLPITENLRLFLFAWRGQSTLSLASAHADTPGRRSSLHMRFGPFSFAAIRPQNLVACGIRLPLRPGDLEELAGERMRERDNWRDATLYYVRFPTWSAAVILGVFPAWAFATGPLRRWRRRRKGLCVRCGYNLTGNESGRCPECGSELTA